MRGERGHPQAKTLSGASDPSGTIPERIDAIAMRSSYNDVLTQSPRPVDSAGGIARAGNRASHSVGDLPLNAANRRQNYQSSYAPGPKHEAPKKDPLALVAAAHRQPMNSPVSIPICILRTKPYIRRLLQSPHSARRSPDSTHAAEQQALESPVAPVNKDTMKELELSAIQNNLSLRIDLCFDDQLFFQPIKGRKGEEKQSRARVFWDCLSLELQAYRHALRDHCPECASLKGACELSDVQLPPRLPVFFSALRDLIGMLVPEKDRKDILATLDVEYSVRMTRVGHFDVVDFSAWLARLLMTHCAPLRDAMAKEMHSQISDGAKSNNMDQLVHGLKTLLSLLENMKLDVANHQVRSFKVPLIADTVPFLKDCFAKMKNDKQIDLVGSYRWFEKLQQRHGGEQRSDFDCFVRGVVSLCESPCKGIPTTFSYDKERLLALRNEILDITQLRICVSTFDELTMLWQGHRPSATDDAEILERLLTLVSSEDGNSEGVTCHLEEIATEIARASSGMNSGAISSNIESSIGNLDPQYATDRLESRLADEQFSVMDTVLCDVTKRTIHHAHQFRKMDTLQLSNSQRDWTTKRYLKSFAPPPEIEDIARRIAHIAVMHWAVWSELLYLAEDDEGAVVAVC